MKKENLFVILTGVVIGIAALVLTALGNPANMGFCIACFERDIAGAVGLHSAAKVQYVRPEIIGLVLGSFLMAIATKEWKAKAGSSPATPKPGSQTSKAHSPAAGPWYLRLNTPTATRSTRAASPLSRWKV